VVDTTPQPVQTKLAPIEMTLTGYDETSSDSGRSRNLPERQW